MSVVKINAIHVPDGRGADLEARFAGRAHDVDQHIGFESFRDCLLNGVSGLTR